MEQAEAALSGPLKLCRIQAKLDRWKAQLEEAIAADQQAGVWPAIPEWQGGVDADYDEVFRQFRDETVPASIRNFHETVVCGQGGSAYTPDQWGDLFSIGVGEMEKLDDWPTLGWWNGGTFLSLGGLIGIVVGFLVCIGGVRWAIR